MSDNTVIQKVKDFISKLSLSEQAIVKKLTEPVVVKAAEVKTADGLKTLSFDGELVEGTPINEITESGVLPLADGEYELADGTELTVTSGAITAIKKDVPADTAVTPTPELNMEAVSKAVATQMSEHSKTLEVKFAENQKELAELKIALSALAKQIKEIGEIEIGSKASTPLVVEEDLNKIPYEQMSNIQKMKFNEMKRPFGV
jgi:hypothetical protein